MEYLSPSDICRSNITVTTDSLHDHTVGVIEIMSSVLSSVTPVDDAAVATASPKVDPEKAVNGSSDHADGHSPELLVAFSEPSDPDNPKDWAPSRKWVVTSVLSATGFNRIMVSTMMAPALPLLMQQFNMSNAEANMALSVYLLATAVGPMVCYISTISIQLTNRDLYSSLAHCQRSTAAPQFCMHQMLGS